MTNYPSEQEGARAFGRYLPISTKHSVEICNALRYKPLLRAEIILQDVLDMKKAIAFRKGREAPHKPGMGPGKYPIKAAGAILNILKSVEKNAVSKNMDQKNLKIVHISASKASRPMRYGRVRGHSKKTHVYVIVAEFAKKTDLSNKKVDQKTEKKEIKNVDSKIQKQAPIQKMEVKK